MEEINYKQQKKCPFFQVKSHYILKILFQNLHIYKYLNIIRYNNALKNRLNKTIKDYTDNAKIEIEIFLYKNELNKYINNIINQLNKDYYHCYLDDKIEEFRDYFNINNNKLSKIKIVIDHEITSLNNLFKGFDFIKKINFIKCFICVLL